MTASVTIVTPAAAGGTLGNRVTADRWAALLRELGHPVSIVTELGAENPDVLVAIHARRSAAAVRQYRARRPDGRVIVLLAGTDLYRDLPAGDAGARQALELADRLVALHPLAVEDVPAEHRGKTRIVVQSAAVPPELAGRRPPAPPPLRICVSGHLREVKDPFRIAEALALVPPAIDVQVVHLGRALEPGTAERAREHEQFEPRYRWLGEMPHDEALRILAESHLLVVSSRMEGAPNVLSEALALGVGILATEIRGTVGLLGPDHPGLFPVGDTPALARLIHRAATDASFLGALVARSDALRGLVRPERERQALAALLAELA